MYGHRLAINPGLVYFIGKIEEFSQQAIRQEAITGAVSI
jgi:hypothetical protein